MNKKKKNPWKASTIKLGGFCLFLILLMAIQPFFEKEEGICERIEGVPAWISAEGQILGYGIINPTFEDGEVMNEDVLIDFLVQNEITFVYNENCYYCQLQKQILGEEDFNTLIKLGLTLDCS
jgi:hypothetical protein